MNFFDQISQVIASAVALVSSIGLLGAPTTPAVNSQPEPEVISQIEEIDPSKYFNNTSNYRYLGYDVEYKFFIPKDGGEILGEVSGSCKGELTGTYSKEIERDLLGSGQVKCQAGPFMRDFDASFTGIFDEQSLEAKIDYESNVPAFNTGSITLIFSN